MSALLALDVAVLPPPAVALQARQLSAAVAAGRSGGFVLDDEHLPHVTLSQQFIRVEEIDAAIERIGELLQGQPPLLLPVTSGGKGARSVWMTIERTAAIVELHERVMEALRGFERSGGGPAAFVDGDARVADVVWVSGYRLKSSFGSFTPHITLGAGNEPPVIEPFVFEADTVAACHLGRHCSCRTVLRQWTLG